METRIEKLDNFGRGITYVNNKITFVEKALPNELVEIEITKEYPKYQEAIVKTYKETSPTRIEEECPYSNHCGGCHLNHLCYNEENKFKKEKVKSILKKLAGIEPNKIETIKYQERNHYRNKVILHGKEKELGLFQEGTNNIIPINECLIVNEKINEIIHYLNKINKNIEKAIIKTSNDNSHIMLDIKGEVINLEELKNRVDVLNYNGKYLSKKKKIETAIGIRRYMESIPSFLQVNNTLTKELYDEVKSIVKEKQPKKVLDLYCGIGTIGIYVADECKEIIGIDYNASNIEDAEENKEKNNIENISFIRDKVENRIDSFHDIDLIIVDPPRAGLDEKTRKYLKEIKPDTILYVSCDPMTLGRDLKDLKEDYEIRYIKLFNMFPRTYHCESISVLERK